MLIRRDASRALLDKPGKKLGVPSKKPGAPSR
jgi:hypothetical protein